MSDGAGSTWLPLSPPYKRIIRGDEFRLILAILFFLCFIDRRRPKRAVSCDVSGLCLPPFHYAYLFFIFIVGK